MADMDAKELLRPQHKAVNGYKNRMSRGIG